MRALVAAVTSAMVAVQVAVVAPAFTDQSGDDYEEIIACALLVVDARNATRGIDSCDMGRC